MEAKPARLSSPPLLFPPLVLASLLPSFTGMAAAVAFQAFSPSVALIEAKLLHRLVAVRAAPACTSRGVARGVWRVGRRALSGRTGEPRTTSAQPLELLHAHQPPRIPAHPQRLPGTLQSHSILGSAVMHQPCGPNSSSHSRLPPMDPLGWQ